MMAKIIVHEPDEFAQWIEDNSGAATKPTELAPVDWGEQLVEQNACATCHSVDGSEMTGPTWKGKFGSQEQLSDGSSVTVDENYLRESILNPSAKVVEGYQNVMPPYQGQLNDDQINAIIEYIKTIE
jgi:cytochrome c oxidase subunit 2